MERENANQKKFRDFLNLEFMLCSSTRGRIFPANGFALNFLLLTHLDRMNRIYRIRKANPPIKVGHKMYA
jgi:hypothetical protein